LYSREQDCTDTAGVQPPHVGFSEQTAGVASDETAGVESRVTAGVASDLTAGVHTMRPLFNGLIDIRAQRSRVYEVLERFKTNGDELKTNYWEMLSPNIVEPDNEDDDNIDIQLLDEVSVYVDGAEYTRTSTFFRPSRSQASMKFFKSIKTIIMLHCDRGMSLKSI
jgi:hypothetical protein